MAEGKRFDKNSKKKKIKIKSKAKLVRLLLILLLIISSIILIVKLTGKKDNKRYTDSFRRIQASNVSYGF